MPYELSSGSLEKINAFADEAEEKIARMVAVEWERTFANPDHKAYLGNSIIQGADKALKTLDMPKLTSARKVELDPAVNEYLDSRGGKYITWLTESGKEDFRNLMVKAYQENGTLSGFAKVFHEQYPQLQRWKSLQIWVTESNLASCNAQFSAYEQVEDVIGFRNVLGNRPCPLCQYYGSYDHKIDEDRPPYHVSCVCLPEPIIKHVHKFKEKKSDPLDYMDKNVYKRLGGNYKEFNKGSILKINLPSLV